MVGIVLVSHSATLAAGVQQLVDQMVHGRVPFALAAGTDNADMPIGTDPMRVLQAIETVYSADGVLVLMDLGSALMSAEAAIDLLPPEQQTQIYLCEAPLVEGTLAAAVAAAGGAPIERVLAEARQAQTAKLAQLTPVLRSPPPPTTLAAPPAERSPATRHAPPDELRQTFIVPNRLGLHARPAARLVGLASAYEATLTISKGDQVADAASINQLLTLGARQGDELAVRAQGPDAASALAALADLIAAGFGDHGSAGVAVTHAPALPTAHPTHLQGAPASAGIALGPAVVLTVAAPVVERRKVTDVVAEQARFETALSTVLHSLALLEQEISRRTTTHPDPTASEASAAGILTAQRLMLLDAALLDRVYQQLAAEQWNAEWVWQTVITALADQYAALEDDYLRQRALDVRDIGDWVLRTLSGQPPIPQPLTTPGILVAEELAPSDAAALDPTLVLGIVTARGGVNDHSAILARTLGIPAVTGVAAALTHLQPGRQVALDGAAGQVWLEPDPTTVATLLTRRADWLTAHSALQNAAHLPAVMQDGLSIHVAANIGGTREVEAALAQGAAGVGLLRTELLLLAQSTLPDEETQFQMYRQVAIALGERPLIIRTLDIGGDKPLPQMLLVQEANPFLGWRGLRYCLDNLDLFRPQVRALLRLAAEQTIPGRIKLMFPMVSTVEEVVAAKALLTVEAAQLTAAGYPLGSLPPLGIMIETPAAVFHAAHLAQQVDFFSIGTNDLTQYIMAADRSNAWVAGLVNHWQPPVLQALAQVARTAQTAGIPVSVCGEMAADPQAAAFLIGLGIHELSMNASALPAVKAQIRRLDQPRATALAQLLLTLPTVEDVEAYLTAHHTI